MLFEFDSEKSDANLQKHGIDFDDVQELWEVDHVIFPARCSGEKRFAILGRLSGQMWIAIYTKRNGATRIISARRATRNEGSLYDKAIDQRAD